MQRGAVINVLLVGYGYWGKNIARVIRQNSRCRLVGVVELNEAIREEIKLYFPTEQVFSSLQESIEKVTIDAVVVATPVSDHYALTLYALENGCSVFCEKVLSKQMSEIENLYRVANKTGVCLREGFTFLTNPAIQYIKGAINAKDLGKVYCVTLKRTGLGPCRSDVDVIFDLAAHDVSILNFWFGLPEWVIASSVNVIDQSKADISFIQLGYKNGMVANVQVSWINPMKQRLIEVVGEKSMIVFDDVDTTEKIRIITTGKDYHKDIKDFGSFQLAVKDGDIVIPNLKYGEPLSIGIESFVNAVFDYNKNNESSAKISREVNQVLCAMHNSLHTNNQKVYLDE